MEEIAMATRATILRLAILCSVVLSASSTSAAVEVRVRKLSGALPKPAAVAFASGSGVIVGKRLVLTNRHIVQDEKKKVFDGFRVFTGPDYKSSKPAKVLAVCDNYDLALIETSADLPFSGITVLDDLPPLSHSVTAYGFPLGSRFGVALTTTGGQVSRHPVSDTKAAAREDADVKAALWHDAILASGNSGGPLFTPSKILVGVNFAYLNTGSKHALAVPANATAEFLRKAGATTGVTFAKSIDASSESTDPQAMTVFIESMVDDISKRAPDLAAATSLNEMLVAKLKTRLPVITPSAFKRVEAGDLHMAFQPSKVKSVEAGDVVRLQGDVSILSVAEESMLVTVDDVVCVFLLPPGEADVVKTKLAQNAKESFALDQAYFVGPPIDVRTSKGVLYALVFLPLNRFTESSEFKEMLEEEKTRRTIAATTGTDERELRAIAQIETRLRRTFTDATGKFRTDAVPVKVGPEYVEMVRMDDKRKLNVPLSRLSADDRLWLRENEKLISANGQRLEKHYTMTATSAAQPAKADR
jgi:S1-C subfamily serine protease